MQDWNVLLPIITAFIIQLLKWGNFRINKRWFPPLAIAICAIIKALVPSEQPLATDLAIGAGLGLGAAGVHGLVKSALSIFMKGLR